MLVLLTNKDPGHLGCLERPPEILISFISLYLISLYVKMLQMLSSKDVNFMGYTYKNFEIVNDHEVPGIGKMLTCACFVPIIKLFFKVHILRSLNLTGRYCFI